MTTTINAALSGGLINSADTSGILQLQTGSTAAVTIDASQNVGIGTANNNVFDQVGGARPLLVQRSDSNTTIAGSLASITICNGDTTTNNTAQINFAAITGANTNQYSGAAISAIFGARTNGQYPSGQLVFSTSTATNAAPTEKMRIDSSGNVGIGSSTVAQKLSVAGASVYQMRIWDGSTATSSYDIGRSNLDGYFRFYGNQTGVTGYVWGGVDGERMRIDSSGNLYLNTTTQNDNGKFNINFTSATNAGIGMKQTNNSTGTLLNFINYLGSSMGYIGASVVSTTYNTTSDYRLKENITPMTGALDKVSALKPVTYKWKLNGSDGQGFIAHELQAVVPDCVTGEKDAVDAEGKPVYQGVDTSFLVATLTAAIQELAKTSSEQQTLIVSQSELINSLTARVTALEAK